MKKYTNYIWYLLATIIIGYLVYRFSFIIVWVLVAAVVSFIGQPLSAFLGRLKIGKLRLPNAITSIISLLLIMIGFFSLAAIFIPLILKEVNTISSINWDNFKFDFASGIDWLNQKAHETQLIPEEQDLMDVAVNKLKSVFSISSVAGVINSILGTAGNFVIGLFSVAFIAFFFIKDEPLFEETILLVVPEKNHKKVREIITESKVLLKRYFIGVILELLGVMTIITLGLWIFGVENALLIGFFGGLMNIIPYLGPLIGTAIGLILGFTTLLATGQFDALWSTMLKIGGVMIGANYVDNLLLQPLIYSNSVKAHPLEIFIVIIMGGSLAGIWGMLLAIPVYTVMRLIAREFLSKFRFVQKLTEEMSEEKK